MGCGWAELASGVKRKEMGRVDFWPREPVGKRNEFGKLKIAEGFEEFINIVI